MTKKKEYDIKKGIICRQTEHRNRRPNLNTP